MTEGEDRDALHHREVTAGQAMTTTDRLIFAMSAQAMLAIAFLISLGVFL